MVRGDRTAHELRAKAQLTTKQIRYGLSVQSWPSGHATDSEEAIEFTELENINCMVEKFPLARANDAFGKLSSLIESFGD